MYEKKDWPSFRYNDKGESRLCADADAATEAAKEGFTFDTPDKQAQQASPDEPKKSKKGKGE